MTSDTKVGLLLGLLFIFVIAFLINGLPSFKDISTDGNEIMTNMMRMDNTAPGLGHHAHQTLFPSYASTANAAPSPEWSLNAGRTEQPPRAVMDLPQTSDGHASYTSETDRVLLPVAQQAQQVAQQVLQQQPPRSSHAKVRYYVVKDGDVLATIAKKVYGKEQGNRHAVVQKLFEANRKSIKSPDQIYVGQKLIIPTLKNEDASDVVMATDLSPALFVSPQSSTKKTTIYTVKEDDSLWKIAHNLLGDGNRYNEIAELNRKIVGDENKILAGMRLRLPN